MTNRPVFFARNAIARAARLTLVCTATAVLISACLGDDDNGSVGGGGGQSISGSVIKGPVSGSTVTAYPLNADGTLGAALGSATTSATGAFTVTLSAAPSGAVALIAVGGTYVSEVERGGRNISIDNMDLLAQALDVPLRKLVDPEMFPALEQRSK